MILCSKCGCENNDGSQYCIHCRNCLPVSPQPSAYDSSMKSYHTQERTKAALEKRIRKRLIIVFLILGIIVSGCLIRVAGAKDRAIALVENYLEQHFTNISSMKSVPYSYGYDEFQGYEVSVALYLTDGGTAYAVGTVYMDSFLSDGELVSLTVNGTEYFR